MFNYAKLIKEDARYRHAELRDRFAMAALTGMLAYSHVSPAHGNYQENCSIEDCASAAYHYADAMLKAREQKGT